jgi:hypothetical protein
MAIIKEFHFMGFECLAHNIHPSPLIIFILFNLGNPNMSGLSVQ